MKYRKQEAKDYARTVLKGVWTALPYNFTEDDRLDEAGIAFNLEHCISKLQIEGHYCSGNVAEFWALTNDERMPARTLNPLRAMHAKWITGYGRPTGRVPSAEMKYWMELIGMVGGPVRAPCLEMTEEAKKRLRADLEATGLPAKAAAGEMKNPG